MDDCASIVSVAEECSCMAYFATIMDVALRQGGYTL